MVIYYEKYRRKNKALVLGSDRMCTVLKKIRNKSAIELLEEYGLDKTVPIDIEQLLRAIGISAIGKDFSELEKRLDKPKGSILGMLLSSGNNAAIFYRKDDSYNRRRFTIANELARATNHLDNEMIEYLEKYLIKFNKAIFMVTHDRYFLERVANKIIEIDRCKIYEYEANYSKFLDLKAKREEEALASQRKRKLFLKKELEWIRAGVQARSTKSKERIQRFE